MQDSQEEVVAILSPRVQRCLTREGKAEDGAGVLFRLENAIKDRAEAIWKATGEQNPEKNWLAAERTMIRLVQTPAPFKLSPRSPRRETSSTSASSGPCDAQAFEQRLQREVRDLESVNQEQAHRIDDLEVMLQEKIAEVARLTSLLKERSGSPRRPSPEPARRGRGRGCMGDHMVSLTPQSISTEAADSEDLFDMGTVASHEALHALAKVETSVAFQEDYEEEASRQRVRQALQRVQREDAPEPLDLEAVRARLRQ
mmetsp:Transcript_12375/g.29082  ORF Transcript_12375/g.29082 Transcript_12375/m.29082 type:complete len:257 (-) Transcript_12375:348-1118(-)|eukprot:CAMPEP_0178391942 /NCGR_PEP_ID=MMETSP0689_2-20121128/11424_1 /TAXON_ID=160604 /ORGANISM="Amphidinium massartii, Strain CS-259" /LENGTH=256 /DNA_ID=CAMNT_0020012503 /DNA_START=44 /DNA_END=814 /DNA_ORIENTATION=-